MKTKTLHAHTLKFLNSAFLLFVLFCFQMSFAQNVTYRIVVKTANDCGTTIFDDGCGTDNPIDMTLHGEGNASVGPFRLSGKHDTGHTDTHNEHTRDLGLINKINEALSRLGF